MKYIFIIISAFAFGWYVNGVRLNLEFTEFKLDAEKQYSKLLEDKILNEKVLKNEITRLEQEKQSAVDDINASYNSLLIKYNSMHSDNRYSNRKDSMSNSPDTTNRPTTTCTCQSSSKNRQGITEALEVGRDCDLLAEKYNRLLKIYNFYQEKY